ncbi:hypothetical protein B566_EDAN009394 [Ephemera danica]|nr:hypothetical protein B566_EDAN009394 [Ephemera danica]
MDDNSFTAVDYQNVVLALLEHIREPVYIPKGDKQIVLAVSVEGEVDVSIEDEEAVSAINKNEVHLEKIEKEKKVSLFMKSAEETITLKPMPKKPNLATFKVLDRWENISLFNPFHKELAAELTTMLMKITDLDEFFATAAYCRDEINSNLFFYSFSVAILHRKDTRNLRMPPYAQIFPDKFIDSNMFPIIYKQVFLDKIEEWELEKNVVLPRVRRLTNLREPIEEGYFPKICITASNQSYAGRPSGTILKVLNNN